MKNDITTNYKVDIIRIETYPYYVCNSTAVHYDNFKFVSMKQNTGTANDKRN